MSASDQLTEYVLDEYRPLSGRTCMLITATLLSSRQTTITICCAHTFWTVCCQQPRFNSPDTQSNIASFLVIIIIIQLHTQCKYSDTMQRPRTFQADFIQGKISGFAVIINIKQRSIDLAACAFRGGWSLLRLNPWINN